MGVAISPAPQRPQRTRRSIRFTFLAMVIAPVLCLVVFWGLTVGFTSSGALIRRGLLSHGHPQLAEIAVQTGAGVIVVLVSAVLMGLFARQLRREVSSLEATAQHLADVQLPQIMSSVREGKTADAGQDFEPPDTRIKEIAQVAAAITSLRHTAVAAAADEARLRNGIAQVFVSLARRNQSLLQRQLHLIDALEQKTADPAELSDLFSLDHLTTRMRRHAENLIILSGASPGRSWSDPVPVIDVIRGAMAEVEDYQRVRVLTRSGDAVIGSAVADMIHLVAELIENATLFSPSGTRVEVRAERVANGFVVEVEDRGLGIQPDLLAELNQKLTKSADFDLADPDRLGLFVVARLASRHSIRVSLNPSPYGGTTAVMLIPHTVVVPVAATRPGITAAGEPGTDDEPRDAAVAGCSQEAFALSGPKPVLPATAEPPPGPLWSAPATASPVTGSTTGSLAESTPDTTGPAGAGGPLPVRGADDPLTGLAPEDLLPGRHADDRLAGLPPEDLVPRRGTDTPPSGPGIDTPPAGPAVNGPPPGPSLNGPPPSPRLNGPPGPGANGPVSGPSTGGPLAGRTGENPLPRHSAHAPPPSPSVDDLLSGRAGDPPQSDPSVDDLLPGRAADTRPPAGPSGDDLFSGRAADTRPPAGPSGDDLFSGRGTDARLPAGPSGDDLFSGRSSDTPLANRTADDLLSRRGADEQWPGREGGGPQPGDSASSPAGADSPPADTPDSTLADHVTRPLLPRRGVDDRQQPGDGSDGPLSGGSTAHPLPRRGASEPPASGSDTAPPAPGNDSAPPAAPGEPASADSPPQAGRVSSFLSRRQASRRDTAADAGKAQDGGGKDQDAEAGDTPAAGRISAFLSGRPASAPPAMNRPPAAPPSGSVPQGSAPPDSAPQDSGPQDSPSQDSPSQDSATAGSASAAPRSAGPGGPAGPPGASGPARPAGPAGAFGPASPGGADAPGGFGGLAGPASPDSPFGGRRPAPVPPAATYRGLPRRVRQASLSPHLRSTGPSDTAPLPVASGPALENRAPERARDFVASFRSGWQRDLPDEPDTQPGPGEGLPGSQAGATPSAGTAQDTSTQQDSGGPPSQAQQRKGPPWKSAARPDPEQT